MSTIRTLLVEDDEAHARLIVERLRSSNEVQVAAIAESLQDAIQRLAEGGPRAFDAVLLDLGLPDSEGIETVTSLHVAAPRVPIVVLSGLRDVAVAVEATRHGAQEYVVKSAADAATLVRALRLAIERKRMQDVEQMLIGVVSHDLRGPLQTIMLGTDVLLEENPESKPAARIRRAALRATSLVNDLLDATRARLAGVFPIELTDVELATVIEHVVEDVRVAHPGRKIELEISDPGPSRADPKRIAQLAHNLIGNALQHSPPASPVKVELGRTAGMFELAVHNVGTPIPEHLRKHLFEPLERGSRERDPSNSIGLGLYIVSEIVRAHDGSIHVDSDEASGTTFLVKLPVKAPGCAPGRLS